MSALVRRSAKLCGDLQQRSGIGLPGAALALPKHRREIFRKVELLKDFERELMVLVRANSETAAFAMKPLEKLASAVINLCVLSSGSRGKGR